MSFLDEIDRFDPQNVLDQIQSKSPQDVERALRRDRLDLADFQALLSPAAADSLEAMAVRAHQTTVQRFGKNILMYAPLYISNECSNGCSYCGFSAHNKIQRKTLDLDEVKKEALALNRAGFRHVLLLTGENPKAVDNDYLAAVVRHIRPFFSSISIEVYPMETEGYRQMVDAGVDGLTIYQETYNRSLYADLHPYGKKRDYDYRLLTPERGGRAGLRRIGVGALLGLDNFRSEGFFTGLHALYLSRKFWRSQLSVSFPRIRPADGGFAPNHLVTDKDLVQLICAVRILLSDVGLVLSTREPAALRDNLVPLGITQMSAGSATSPGGYCQVGQNTEQFAIDDGRSPAEFSEMLRSKGYEVVWKDWDQAFLVG